MINIIRSCNQDSQINNARFKLFLLFLFIITILCCSVQADDINFNDANSSEYYENQIKNIGDIKKGIEDIEQNKNNIIEMISHITCETKGMYDILRAEYSHTCVPEPFLSLINSSFLKGIGTFLPMLLKINMVDNRLFGNEKYVGGQCSRENRADPEHPTISFGLCKNVLLAQAAIKAAAQTAKNIGSSIASNENIWEGVKRAWHISPKDYNEVHLDVGIGYSGKFWDINAGFPILNYKVVQSEDKICVAVDTLYSGLINVGCKYIKEPCPNSMYNSFFEGNDTSNSDTVCYATNNSSDHVVKNSAFKPLNLDLVRCSKVGDCYTQAFNNSKTIIPITSTLIECLRVMISKFLIANDVCEISTNAISTQNSTFYKFQKNMHQAVLGFLTLYIIFWGIGMLFRGQIPEKKEFMNAVIKLVLVMYFSIGINMNGGSEQRFNGMIEFVFPVLLKAAGEVTSWVVVKNGSNTGLCHFEPSEYKKGQEHLALWDSLDCRVTHYLGLNFLKDAIKEKVTRVKEWKKYDPFGFSIPPYYFLLIPAIMTGNMTLVSLALAYPLMVISVAAYMVNIFVVCLIGVLILGVLAPFFIPMVLFEYTRSYFDQWVKLLLSFIFQPMVVAIFMVLMFAVYEYGFYTDCRYKEIKVDEGSRIRKMFVINVDDNNNPNNQRCKRSLGWMLNNPMHAVINTASTTVDAVSMSDNNNQSMKMETQQDFISQFPFLKDGLEVVQGLFFKSTQAVFQVLKDLTLAMVTACLTLYLMYHISARLSSFAAEMAEGVNLGSVVIAPQTLFKLGMSAVAAAGAAAGAVGGSGAGGIGNTGATTSRSGINVSGVARDLVSRVDNVSKEGSNNTAGDSISKGKLPSRVNANNIDIVAGDLITTTTTVDTTPSSGRTIEDINNQVKNAQAKSNLKSDQTYTKSEITKSDVENIAKSRIDDTNKIIKENPIDNNIKNENVDRTATAPRRDISYVDQELTNPESDNITRSRFRDTQEKNDE